MSLLSSNYVDVIIDNKIVQIKTHDTDKDETEYVVDYYCDHHDKFCAVIYPRNDWRKRFPVEVVREYMFKNHDVTEYEHILNDTYDLDELSDKAIKFLLTDVSRAHAFLEEDGILADSNGNDKTEIYYNGHSQETYKIYGEKLL